MFLFLYRLDRPNKSWQRRRHGTDHCSTHVAKRDYDQKGIEWSLIFSPHKKPLAKRKHLQIRHNNMTIKLVFLHSYFIVSFISFISYKRPLNKESTLKVILHLYSLHLK